ncbi:MAG: DUF2185 domain-containing protein [Clostridia bacterium]|nr:DUF2185 domain-containing protein [Clostridia bacterium]
MKNEEIGFILENVAERNKLDARHFLKPSDDEIKQLAVGDIVKLNFLISKELENGCRAERMWVEIQEIDNDSFVGVLTNQPAFINTINAGDTINFSKDNIATVIVKNNPFDFSKMAVISNKAIENREINWAIRSDELNDEQDSGWSLFFGDEDDDYLNDYHNVTIISLENAMQIEPLLENVFTQNGEAYVFDRSLNMFVEDKE